MSSGFGHEVEEQPKWYKDGRSVRLVIFGGLLLAFCLTEMAVGVFVKSLVLLTDSIHLLSDVTSLIIGFLAIYLAKKRRSQSYSYGLIRFETVGALANSCFLIALCLFIFLEAIQRFIEYGEVKETMLVVYVGCAGFALNLFGILLFCGSGGHGHSHGGGGHGHSHGSHGKSKPKESHGHSHGSHGHSHGSHGHSHSEENHGHSHSSKKPTSSHGHSHSSKKPTSHAHDSDHELDLAGNGHSDFQELEEMSPPKKSESQESLVVVTENDLEEDSDDEVTEMKTQNLNMRAILIHIIGDFLGSLAVIASGLLETYLTWEYRFYIDPIASIAIALLILGSAIPILKSSAAVLLQSVPQEINLSLIERRLKQISGVKGVHELHIWRLHESKVIASGHVVLEDYTFASRIMDDIKGNLHKMGIHSSSIQIELQQPEPETEGSEKKLRARDIHSAHSKCVDVVCAYNCSENWCCEKSD